MPARTASERVDGAAPAIPRRARRTPARTPAPLGTPPAPAPRPFLKWAGGKAQLLPQLLCRAPLSAPGAEGARIETYFEPFLGGGALFFALLADPTRAPRRAVLNDLNTDLMTTFEVVRDAPDRLARRLDVFAGEYAASDSEAREAMFYRVRAARPRAPLEVAARVIFLNKTCFNGLYRVNRKGEFNVPFGRYAAPRICDLETLLAASAALQGAELRHVDFEQACADAQPGDPLRAQAPSDFVYCDPPFHPLSATSSFTSYTDGNFGLADQIRLKRCIDALTARGVAVMLSNSPHPDIRGGYLLSGYSVEEVPARRAINSRGDRRGPIGELIITNYELIATMRA